MSMKRAALIVALVVGGCHSSKPEGTSSATGSAVAAVATTPPPVVSPSPAAAQPKRSPEDDARVNRANHALSLAMESAKRAKTLKEACDGVGGLDKGLIELHHVTPPAGFERPFADGVQGVFMLLDVIQTQHCAEGSGLDADTIRSWMDNLHDEVTKLEQVGAKP
jgi:hypothetical protein